jgi:predicted AlkP superfamily phosphohydrolase/phosphomutase
MSAPSHRKVVMIGLDAMDLDLVEASLDDLPNLRELFSDGETLRLRSPAEHLTSAVWPTFATGLPPGHHGIYYPMQWDPRSMRLRRVDPSWIDARPFWQDLDAEGVRATIVDVPFRLPTALERGTELSNWGSQERLGPTWSNRAGLTRAVCKRFGRHPMGVEIPTVPTPDQLQRLEADLVDGAHRKAALTRHLLRETDWDLFVTVFAEPHRAGHSLWPLPGHDGGAVPQDALTAVYRAVDEAVGTVLAEIDRNHTDIVVFSVHGMGPGFTQEHFAQPVIERVDALARGVGSRNGKPPAPGAGSLTRSLRALVPGQAQRALARALPEALRDRVAQRAFLGGLDFARTLGFALPCSGESYVRQNIAGRERDGHHPADSVSQRTFRAFLERTLRGLREVPGGAPVVRDVIDTDQVYPGPKRHLLPDAVILWERCLPTNEIESPDIGRLHGRLMTGHTGDHRPEGFAVLRGPSQGRHEVERPVDVAGLAAFARSLLGHARAV